MRELSVTAILNMRETVSGEAAAIFSFYWTWEDFLTRRKTEVLPTIFSLWSSVCSVVRFFVLPGAYQ